MTRIKEFLRNHRPVAVLMGIVLVLTTIPILDIYLVVGDTWQGILPPLSDDAVYTAHIQNIAGGYPNDGNPYFYEHRNDPPIVIFGGAWIDAIPFFAGMPLNTALFFNFIIWSLAFAAVLYWLFRELRVKPWVAVLGTVLLYLQAYARVWRPANLQPVWPFYFLFYIALIRLVREQSRRNIVMLALATGSMFYLFAYLWQTAVITLGLLFLYALACKNWPLLKATVASSVIGGVIGLPVLLYTLWLSHTPYFWESMYRFGLVNTHLPMAEVIYSGGWVGFMLAFLAILYFRVPALRKDTEFISLSMFLCISGLGLWIMQGSNLITGKLFENGEHLRGFILLWLAFATVIVGSYVWKRRAELSTWMQAVSVAVVMVCSIASLYYTQYYFSPFINVEVNRESWQTEQLYAKPFAWLQNQEKNPVVVWSDPHQYVAPNLSVYTRHFTLYAPYGMWRLLSEREIRERYLVSQYFDNPTVADLKNDMVTYLGRPDVFHNAKTIERGIKICRILYFWDRNKDCGIPPTSAELLGDKFFNDLEQKFTTDIKPNIKEYLAKYHVSYILKDVVLDPQYKPKSLGAKLVYSDGRFEIYTLP
ncbi:MAG: hypothetical protein Q7S50_03620 [bacterium]|nr:hypothetical protein [bacterium]